MQKVFKNKMQIRGRTAQQTRHMANRKIEQAAENYKNKRKETKWGCYGNSQTHAKIHMAKQTPLQKQDGILAIGDKGEMRRWTQWLNKNCHTHWDMK